MLDGGSENNTTLGNNTSAAMRLVNTYTAAFGRRTEIQFACADTAGQGYLIAGIAGEYTNWTGGGNGCGGDLVFGTKNSSSESTISEKVRIKAGGNVGIGVTDPDEKLEVDGNIKLTDPTNDRVWATKKVFNILDFDADSSGTNDSKRAIQDAIDAASDAGGGTVIIPTGTYRVDAFGGTATGGSGTTLVDTAAHFTSRDIAVGDIVINLTNHCAGKITQINSDTAITVDDFVGNSNDADNSFSNGDNYVIPGIAMRDKVELSGQSFGSVLQANPIKATDGTAYSGAIVLISADPSETWPTYKIQNLKIDRNGSWSAIDATDVGIDVYNHRFEESAPQNGPVAWVIVDRIRFDHLASGNYHFSTGIRLAAWSGTLSNCDVASCKIGIDLDLPDDDTNNVLVITPSIYRCDTGLKINGLNNRVIGGQFHTGVESAGPGNNILIDIQDGKKGNSIFGPYFEGYGNDAIAIKIGDSCSGNAISACYFDMAGTNALDISEHSGAAGKNSIYGNYSCKPGNDTNKDWCIPANLGIGTSSPDKELHVAGEAKIEKVFISNASQSILKMTDANDNGGADFGFNHSNDTAFISNLKYGSAGKNIELIVKDTSGDDVIGIRILGGTDANAGNVGVGTTSPTAKLDINPGTISESNPNIRLRGVTSSTPYGGEDGDIQIYESGSNRRLYIKINDHWRYATLT